VHCGGAGGDGETIRVDDVVARGEVGLGGVVEGTADRDDAGVGCETGGFGVKEEEHLSG
jgi:hypothetical protein